MAIEIKAPEPYDKQTGFKVFLAGAIDQGSSVDWQSQVSKSLADLDVVILNPRRDDWDASWEQCATCEPFRSQVLWEVDAIESCDLLIVCFTKDSKAPITFFEFGAFGTRKDAIVCAEEGFYRQGNLDIYCEHWGVPMYHNLEEMIDDLHAILEARA